MSRQTFFLDAHAAVSLALAELGRLEHETGLRCLRDGKLEDAIGYQRVSAHSYQQSRHHRFFGNLVHEEHPYDGEPL